MKSKPDSKQNLLEISYFLLPVILFVLQAIFTLNSRGQVRYEELAESVRNPFWLANRVIYDSISSNVGWNGLLAIIYNFFGFNLFTAKFVRLILQAVSLGCLTAILKRYLGTKRAFLPLLTIGLSPTLLYFTALQAQYGIDLQYLPICIYLLIKTASREQSVRLITSASLWLVAMIAWLSYPSFVFYLPAIAFCYIGILLRQKRAAPNFSVLRNLSLSLIFFLTPLVAAFLYVKNRQLLITDSTGHYGLFRGAGVLSLNLQVFWDNLRLNFINLFIHAFGYNYELNWAEFSGFFPILAILFIIFSVFLLWRSNRKLHLAIILIFSVLFFNILISYFSVDPTPGLRRTTGILAVIYALFVFSWSHVMNLPKKQKLYRILGIFCLSLLTIHHLFSYPINLSHLADPSLFAEKQLSTTGDPANYLKILVDKVQSEDLNLACVDNKNNFTGCRYSEVYAAVAGSCLWNRLYCHRIEGYDTKTQKMIPLNIDLWSSYYFDH